jgi:hypothetical protein
MFGKNKKKPAPKKTKKPPPEPAKSGGATVVYKTVTMQAPQAQRTPVMNAASAHHPNKSRTQPKTINLALPASIVQEFASSTSS